MKKSITPTKLKLARETLVLLNENCLKAIAGGAPVMTRDIPCPQPTGKVACG